MTTDDFPFANATNPEHVARMREMEAELVEDLADTSTYTSARLAGKDRAQLKRVRKWLQLVPKSE